MFRIARCLINAIDSNVSAFRNLTNGRYHLLYRCRHQAHVFRLNIKLLNHLLKLVMHA
ncbi:Uncharacterised protein [Vibrio cholerae]|nr:Uncharacterised protein [Vibrio cholerae]